MNDLQKKMHAKRNDFAMTFNTHIKYAEIAKDDLCKHYKQEGISDGVDLKLLLQDISLKIEHANEVHKNLIRARKYLKKIIQINVNHDV